MELRDLKGRAYIDSGWAGFSPDLGKSPRDIFSFDPFIAGEAAGPGCRLSSKRSPDFGYRGAEVISSSIQ